MKGVFKKNKIISNILEFISSNKLFLSYIVLSLVLSIALRVITIGGFPNIKATLTDLLFSFLLGSFCYLFKNKGRFIYLFCILIFMSLLCGINTLYYQFYMSFVSVNLISTATYVGKVNASLWDKIHIIQFSYFLCPIIFALINEKLKKDNYFEKIIDIKKEKKTIKSILFTSFIMVIFLVCSITLNDVSKFSTQYNREYIVKKYGLYLYSFNDLFQSFELNSSIDYDNSALEFREYYSCKEDTEDNEYTNIFKGKNVIFIHAESIQNFLLDLKINGEYVTPNIRKFASEGLYFSKFYPQISVGTSSDTEFTLLTGLLPSSKGTVFVNYYDSTYYGMPSYFNKLGYYTFSMHANDRDYWNRDTMHENLGYQRFYGKESYIVDEENIVGLGLSDKEFFKQSIPMLKSISEQSSPYFGTIITLSNHSPYNDTEKYGEFDVTLSYSYTDEDGNKIEGVRDYLEGTKMGNYIKSAHYADEAFGELIESLKESNLLDNTVIVFYGDHESRISKSEFDYLYNYDPINDEIKDESDPSYISMDNYYYDLNKNTPLIIWTLDNNENLNKEVTKVMGMYDVLPTIANMFGFDEKYSLGKDIFSDNEGIVVFPNGNILTDKVYYSDSNEEYITFTDTPIEEEYINNIKEYATKVLNISNGIIHYDLIKNEESKIGECNEKK